MGVKDLSRPAKVRVPDDWNESELSGDERLLAEGVSPPYSFLCANDEVLYFQYPGMVGCKF